jgi:hypothetical protein
VEKTKEGWVFLVVENREKTRGGRDFEEEKRKRLRAE